MIAIVFIFLLMFLLKSSVLFPFSNPQQSISIAIGFILIFAFLFGKKISRLNLPQITGFIIAGLICGPYLMKFLSVSDVRDLQLLDGLALSLIALTAGGEMRLGRLRESMKSIAAIVFFQTAIIITGFVLLGVLGTSLFPFFSGKTVYQAVAVSLLLGTLATATSPSTTIAVITETRSKGKYTDLVLNTAVVKDFFVIILFAFSLAFSKTLVSPVLGFDFRFLLHVLRDVGGSVLLGTAVGVGIVLYLKFIQKEMAVFILSIAFFTYQISQSYGFHPLLICLLAGFLVENFSSQGENLILALEKVSLPVYVVFFAISGASINLPALQKSWLLALICVIWRGALKFSGTYLGARVAGEEPGIRKRSWTGFISQAGVALGMAIVIERTFPDWGTEFKTLVLAIIAINQIIGPVLFQQLLVKVKEAGRKEQPAAR